MNKKLQVLKYVVFDLLASTLAWTLFFIYRKYVNDPDSKIAGYACYNMALASEVFGEFDIALDWAQRAYSEYRLKAARDYINTIERRIRDAEALKRQMNEE